MSVISTCNVYMYPAFLCVCIEDVKDVISSFIIGVWKTSAVYRVEILMYKFRAVVYFHVSNKPLSVVLKLVSIKSD